MLGLRRLFSDGRCEPDNGGRGWGATVCLGLPRTSETEPVTVFEGRRGVELCNKVLHLCNRVAPDSSVGSTPERQGTRVWRRPRMPSDPRALAPLFPLAPSPPCSGGPDRWPALHWASAGLPTRPQTGNRERVEGLERPWVAFLPSLSRELSTVITTHFRKGSCSCPWGPELGLTSVPCFLTQPLCLELADLACVVRCPGISRSVEKQS